MNDFDESMDPRSGFFHRFGHGHRANRGDISPIILHLLQEKPMHGYEIIRTLEERSHGFWRPSAGSIYPILQMLEEQEFVSSHEEGGKKIYTITEAGKAESTKNNPWARHEDKQNNWSHWENRAKNGKSLSEMRLVIKDLMVFMKDITFQGSPEDISEMHTILTETRDRIEVIAKKNR